MNLYQASALLCYWQRPDIFEKPQNNCTLQPSLSHSISPLEPRIGGTLFEKQGQRSCTPSKDLNFWKYVEKSLDVLDGEKGF